MYDMKNFEHKILIFIIIICILLIPIFELTIKLILFLIIIAISIYLLKERKEQNNIEIKENLKKGYIIDVNCCQSFGEIVILVDGKIYKQSTFEKDDTFMNIYNDFNKNYTITDNEISFLSQEIDVYVYKNKIKINLENIKKEDKDNKYEIKI